MTFSRNTLAPDRQRLLAEQTADATLVGLGRDFVFASDRHVCPCPWTWGGIRIIQLPRDIMAT